MATALERDRFSPTLIAETGKNGGILELLQPSTTQDANGPATRRCGRIEASSSDRCRRLVWAQGFLWDGYHRLPEEQRDAAWA